MFPRRIPLRFVLVLPVLLQIGAVVGLAGWLSQRIGDQAVNEVASQVQTATTQRLHDDLLNYVALPHQINQINADAIRLGHLALLNDRERERFFAQRLVTFPSLAYNFWAHIQNDTLVEYLGARHLDEAIQIIRRDAQTSENRYYAVDAQGYAGELVQVAPGFDPRDRPWYQAAIARNGPAWSGVYRDFSTGGLTMTAALPVYSSEGGFLGVVGATLVCGDPINDLLKQHQIGQQGLAFIVDAQGELVGTSSGSRVFVFDGEDNQRLAATASEHALTREAATFLTEQLTAWEQLEQAQQLSFTVADERYYLEVMPLRDALGLDWRIITVARRSELMAPLQTNIQRTMQLLGGLAFGVAIGWGWLTARWLSRSLLQVSQAADRVAQGNFEQPVPPVAIVELHTLTTAFNHMATQIQTALKHVEVREAQPSQAPPVAPAAGDTTQPPEPDVWDSPEA